MGLGQVCFPLQGRLAGRVSTAGPESAVGVTQPECGGLVLWGRLPRPRGGLGMCWQPPLPQGFVPRVGGGVRRREDVCRTQEKACVLDAKS